MTTDILNPEDTGASKLQPRDALLQALDGVRRGMGDDQLARKFGAYAAAKARETWKGLHTKQWGTRAAAMVVLQHEMRDDCSKPLDRILAAKGLLEAVDRHQAMQDKLDSTLLTDAQLRDHAIQEWRRPSRIMADLIIEAWSDPAEAMVTDILRAVMPKYEELLAEMGYVKRA